MLTGQGSLAFCSGGDQSDPGRRRLRRRARHRTPERARPADPDPPAAEAGRRDGRRATRSAAATCCTCAATSRSPPTTRASARPGPGSARSTAGTASTCSPRQIGEKRAKEVWFLCRQYDAATALDWGLVNAVVPVEELERTTVQWCREMLALSPLALRLLKAGSNAGTDGLAGVQQLAGDATLLYYMSEEAQEGRDAFTAEARARLLAVPQAAVSVEGRSPRRPRVSDRRATAVALGDWWRGARPRTLGAGLVPVVLGAAAAGEVIWWRLRGRARRRRRAAGRRELRERLLRRRARRRHARAPRSTTADGERRRDAARGADRGPDRARGRGGRRARARARHRAAADPRRSARSHWSPPCSTAAARARTRVSGSAR